MGKEIVGALVLSRHGDIISTINSEKHILIGQRAFHRCKMASIGVVYNEAVNVILTAPRSASQMRGCANI